MQVALLHHPCRGDVTVLHRTWCAIGEWHVKRRPREQRTSDIKRKNHATQQYGSGTYSYNVTA